MKIKKTIKIKQENKFIFICCSFKLYKYEDCRCEAINIIQQFMKKWYNKVYNLQQIHYNNSIIKYNDINVFNNFERCKNDNNNKMRENIIVCIINNILQSDYYKYSFRWNKLRKEINSYIEKLCEYKNIETINSLNCIHKAGRIHHYDFKIIINDDIYFNVEFKFNAECVSDAPQFVSPMNPSQYLETSYEEYYYENYLPILIDEYKLLLPNKKEYMSKIHSANPDCVNDIQIKYYKGCKQSSKYTSNIDDINFYNKSNELSKQSIVNFIENNSLLYDKLSNYLLETQKNKFYMLYKNENIYIQTINQDNYIIIDFIKEPKKYRYIAKTKSGIEMKILLRWKNGNGIAYPAFQIS